MAYVLEVEIPGLPAMNSSSRLNRWRDITEKNRWANEVMLATRGKRPAKPLQRAKVTYIRRSAVEPDYVNLVASFKHPEDGLVKAGIIVDDKPSVIGRPDIRWEKVAARNGSIVLRVEEFDGLHR